MRGDRRADGSAAPPPFLAMGDASSVMWNRAYGKERYSSPAERHGACRQLKTALDAAGCDRLVVGHTPQLGGANCECGGTVWRLDVGMSSGVLNARPAVLELPRGGADEPRVLVVGGPACTLPPPIVNRDGKRNSSSAKDVAGDGDGGAGGSAAPRPGVRAGRRGLGNLVRGGRWRRLEEFDSIFFSKNQKNDAASFPLSLFCRGERKKAGILFVPPSPVMDAAISALPPFRFRFGSR